MFKNIDRIILYALLVGVAVVIFLMIRNKKDSNAQSSLLLAMAEKLKIDNTGTPQQSIIEEEPIQLTEDDSETVRIAEKLYFKKPLTKEENKYYSEFIQSIDDELNFSKQFHPLVQQFIDGKTEFTEEQKAFYEANKDLIDDAVQNQKFKANTESTQKDLSKANPPLAPGERLEKILSLFEDGIPKNVTQISELYSKITGTSASKGNISNIFGKLEGKELFCQKIKNDSRWKVYYGLPQWFDGKKLKPEYKQKIS